MIKIDEYNRAVLKTVGDFIEYMSQFPKNTKVIIPYWDCYNDEPSNRIASASVIEKGKKNVKKEIWL